MNRQQLWTDLDISERQVIMSGTWSLTHWGYAERVTKTINQCVG